MNKKQLIQRCLISDDAVETYPFGQDIYKDTCVMRHKSNDKWFALVFYLDKKLYINVKTEPEIGEEPDDAPVEDKKTAPAEETRKVVEEEEAPETSEKL